MSWQKTIPGCFGERDCIFAGHPLDEERARAAIKAAKASGASKEDFEKEMVWHCYKEVTAPGMLQDHIQTQIKKLESLWK